MGAVPAVLAIDQGTTGSTALIITQDGRIAAKAYSEFTQHFPTPGWVEHDASEIWDVTQKVARRALQEASGVDVRSVGITNQRETVVVWDRETLEPLGRAIVWQDRRTAGLCRELREQGHETTIREATGLVLDPYFSGTKLRWRFDEDPSLRRRAERGEVAVGTIDTWLIARLTEGDVHATDHTNASRTLLYDLEQRGWSEELLELMTVPRECLPEVRCSSGDFGCTTETSLGVSLPIAGVAGDQQAALFGQGCWRPGDSKCTYGTGAFLLMNTGQERVPSANGLLTTMACDEEGGPAYALEGSIFVAGAAIQWLRDGLGILEAASETEDLARSLSSNEGVYLVPAFVGLGAPIWDPEARGVITGLTRGTGRAHLARAALEAMAYGTLDVLRTMEEDSGVQNPGLKVDGGVTHNGWFLEFMAGVLGVDVHRPGIVETTALGAAGLAGLATGVWNSSAEFQASLTGGAVFHPAMPPSERDLAVEGWRRAVDAALAAKPRPHETGD